MASPTQLVQFTFAGGIDQSVRDEVTDPSSAFVFIQNGRQGARGALTKRLGLDDWATDTMDGSTISVGSRAFTSEKRTCFIDGTYLREWIPTTARWISRGRVPEAALSMIGLPSVGGTSSSTMADCVVCGSYVVTISTGPNGCYSTILDAKTGGIAKAAEQVTSATDYAMLATYGNYVFAFFGRPNSSTIRYQYIDLSTWTSLMTGWTATANAATDAHPTRTNLSLSTCSLSDRVALIYINNNIAAPNRVSVKTLQTSGVVDSATMTTASVVVDHVAIAPDGAGSLVAAWNETTNVKVCALSSALAVTGTATTVISSYSASSSSTHHAIDIVGSGTAGAGRVFANHSLDSTGDRIDMSDFLTLTGAVAAAGSIVTVYNARKIGRAFRYGTRYYALCRGYESAKRDAVVCDLSAFVDTWLRPVANIRPGLATGKPYSQASTYGTQVFIPVTTQTTGSTYAGELAALDFSSTQRWQPARFSKSVFLSGSLVTEYDGHTVFESAFLIHPPKPTTALSGTGLTGTNYRYVAVYEHVDANANWHVSGVSDPSATVSPANQTVTVTVRPLSISGRVTATTDSNVRISLYRTLTGGEPPYYYLTSLDNTLSASTQTYDDTTSDATISARAKLYAPSLPGINGSSQDHRAPPGLTHIKAGNGVLVGAVGEDLWHSSQDISGEGIWWSPVFSGPVSGDGDITAIEYQDGTFYVFKRRAIYAVTCEPPTDNGASGGLGTPRRLAADVGCIDNRSTLVTSMGIFFQSERGIEILTRGQNVEWIGEQIRDTLGTQSIVGATLDATTGMVYLEGNGANTPVYDLTRRLWQSIDTRTFTPAGSAIVWDETQSAYKYAVLSSDGKLWVEQASSYLDNGSTWVTLRARTGWVKLGGIQGQQIVNRVLLLAKKATSADVSISLAYDYDSSFETASTYTATTTDALSTALGRIQVQHSAHDKAEGQSVRVDIADATPTGGASVGTGKGATWVALTFEGQPRPNAAEVSEEAA